MIFTMSFATAALLFNTSNATGGEVFGGFCCIVLFTGASSCVQVCRTCCVGREFLSLSFSRRFSRSTTTLSTDWLCLQ
uniref:Putative secreted peptide n=1 Tax=Anopheles braziliensis TaxID=58242 RepID=A0A2M3ZSB5_9DIPT